MSDLFTALRTASYKLLDSYQVELDAVRAGDVSPHIDAEQWDYQLSEMIEWHEGFLVWLDDLEEQGKQQEYIELQRHALSQMLETLAIRAIRLPLEHEYVTRSHTLH